MIFIFNIFFLQKSPFISCMTDHRGYNWGGLAQWLASLGVPGSRPGRGTVCCGLEQVTFTHCSVLVKPD